MSISSWFVLGAAMLFAVASVFAGISEGKLTLSMAYAFLAAANSMFALL